MADDPHVWASALFDEVVVIGDALSGLGWARVAAIQTPPSFPIDVDAVATNLR